TTLAISHDATITGTTGELTDGAGSDSLVNDGTISSTTGVVTIDPAGPFTNHGLVYSNGGTIVVNPAGGLTNFANGVLTGGMWTVDGTLELAGDNITRNDATIDISFGSKLSMDAAGGSAL